MLFVQNVLWLSTRRVRVSSAVFSILGGKCVCHVRACVH